MRLKTILLIVAVIIATCCTAQSVRAENSYQVIVSGNTGGSPCSEVFVYDLDGNMIPNAIPNPFGASATYEYHSNSRWQS